MSTKMKLYAMLPAFVQNVVVSITGYLITRRRFGHNFQARLQYYEASDYNEIDVKQLRSFLKAASLSPFWEKRFSSYNVNIDSKDLLIEIGKLPILTKEEVKKNIKEILVDTISEKTISVNTSGTTGSGLQFVQTQSMENSQWAIWWRYRRRHGITLDTWMGWFGGKVIIPLENRKKPYWRINYGGKQVMFSSLHLNEHTIRLYYEEIKNRKLSWLHGYPSQLALLAALIKAKKLKPLKVKHITIGSENLFEHQKEIIKEMLGSEPLQHYGLAEGVANISQLPDGNLVRDQDFALCEFVKSNSDPEVHKIIGTNYNNLAFPLIRYDTGDLVRLDSENRINSIDGRADDYVLLKNGVKLGRLGFIFHEATYVREAQIFQKDIGTIILRIVKNDEYLEQIHEKKILSKCKERFGDNVNILFEYLDEIPRTKSGKLRLVVSDLKQ